MLNDADVTLPSLGANQSYGLAETFYFTDPTERKSEGQSIAAEAAQNGRLHMVCFWTTPWGGDGTTGNAYPFAIEDFFPPPAN
jgi:hypothetical protein